MSLFTDICAYENASEGDLEFDSATNSWTVISWLIGGDEKIPLIQNKEQALAILRALDAAFRKGGDMASYS